MLSTGASAVCCGLVARLVPASFITVKSGTTSSTKGRKSASESSSSLLNDPLKNLSLSERKVKADLAFSAWTLKKSRYDRGLLLLSSVTDDRVEKDPDQTYRDVCLAMVSTDAALNYLHQPPKDAKTLKKTFYNWCLARVTYRDLILTEKDVLTFTPGKRTQFIVDEKTGVTTLPSVKYIFAKKKGATDNAKIALRKALNPDQVASNRLFTSEFKRKWKFYARVLYALAVKELGEEEEGGDSASGAAAAGKENSKKENSEEGKEETKTEKPGEEEKAEEPATPTPAPEKGGEEKTGEEEKAEELEPLEALLRKDRTSATGVSDEEAITMNASTFETSGNDISSKASERRWEAFLFKHGVAVLEDMLAEDEDIAKAKAEKAETEKLLEASQAYEGFVRKKDSCKIRMPVEPERVVGGHWKPPRLDFSMGKGLIRSKRSAIPTNTVELLAGSGLKYVHALKKGRNGMDMDLEKCKQKLVKDGHVFRENFTADSDDEEEGVTSVNLFENEIRANKSLAIKRAADNSRKLGNKKAFDLWRTKKEMCERAMKALFAVDKPEADADDQESEQKKWIKVGKALKAIDRNLYKSWVEWSDGFQSNYKCQALWDFFPPKCCDIHSSAYSGVRDTFLKLLRPGLDYKSVFEHQCERKWGRLERKADEAGEDLDDYLMKALNSDKTLSKTEVIDRMELNKKDMRAVMRDLGVKLEGEELRRLVDAFDVNGDGSVNKKEFLQFITPETSDEGLARLPISVVRGDTSSVLERKCVHETTCRWTGMPNAFVVTIGKTKKKGEKEEHGIRIIEKKDGTTRRIVQLDEREKRWSILQHFNLHEELGGDELEDLDEAKNLPIMCQLCKWDTMGLYGKLSNSKNKNKNKNKDDDDDDGGYSEDEDEGAGYSDDGDDDDDDDTSDGLSLRVKEQKKALKYLMKKSCENRAALTLKDMMDKGSPPPAPKLWAAEVGHPDVGRGYDVLTESLLLCWKAPPGSLVAFFSLEMSGAMGSKAQQNNEFKEIFKDPPDAAHEAAFTYWAEGLVPNTTYTFRIRAFNGFGPGPYTRMDFTTQPASPASPVVVRTAVNTATIKWKFGSKNGPHFVALRKVFEKLESQSSPISRPDLLNYLEGSSPELIMFLRSTMLSDHSMAGISLFDAIESHGDDNVTFFEIERYQELIDDDESGHETSNVSLTRTKYVVEQCVSQHEASYVQVWRGSAGEALGDWHAHVVLLYVNQVPAYPGVLKVDVLGALFAGGYVLSFM